jgi:hypothetical protein
LIPPQSAILPSISDEIATLAQRVTNLENAPNAEVGARLAALEAAVNSAGSDFAGENKVEADYGDRLNALEARIFGQAHVAPIPEPVT